MLKKLYDWLYQFKEYLYQCYYIKKILRMKKLNSVNTNKEKILIITFLLSNDGSHNSNFSVVKLNKNRHFIFNLYLPRTSLSFANNIH